MAKKVLVTGGSRGIGDAIAKLLILNDYEVYAPSSRDLDLSSQESIDAYFKENFRENDSLYALISNAGIFHSAPLAKHSLENWQKIIDLNLTGAFRICRKALPYLQRENGANIVFISSISAQGEAFAPAYSASKAGINGLCKALAPELASDNINVNAIAPGWVKTDLAKSILYTEELEKNHLGASLQNRWIEPAEIAGLVKYLLSPEAKAITGQILTIDAGLS